MANPDQPLELPFDDDDFVRELWDAYYVRLRSAIRHRVRAIRRPAASESEIAASAFNSFVNRARDGKFPNILDHDSVWKLLKTIAIRKANDVNKTLRAQKRGGIALFTANELAGDASQALAGVDAAPGSGPSPSLDIEVADLFNTMLMRLPDDRHRDVILLKLQGASLPTIAECLGTTTRTVQRLIKKIEQDWQRDFLA